MSDHGPKGRFRALRPTQLHVDNKYQRGKRLARAKEMVEDFNWPAFGCLVVSRRKSSYFVIDGQHRAVAAAILELESVPCLVFQDLALKNEAAAFTRINGKRWGMGPVEMWKARLVEEHEPTCEAQKILSRYGFKVGERKNGSHTVLRCGTALLTLYERGLLADVLHLMTACWPKHPMLYKASLIRGIGRFIVSWRGLTRPDDVTTMHKKLRGTDLSVLLSRASGLIIHGNSRSQVEAVHSVLCDCYNKGNRREKIVA